MTLKTLVTIADQFTILDYETRTALLRLYVLHETPDHIATSTLVRVRQALVAARVAAAADPELRADLQHAIDAVEQAIVESAR